MITTIFVATGFLLASANASTNASLSACKNNPFNSSWPSLSDWDSLNSCINNSLLSTRPVASTCWPGNPFNSSMSCSTVESNWTSSIFHAAFPESIGTPLFANNSCLPPGSSGYLESQNCRLGGLPSYIVNATCASDVAFAMKWAADRNLRIVVKGTGHDLAGRSSGAFGLSIWTRNVKDIKRNTAWNVPGLNQTEDVFIFGSGANWVEVLKAAMAEGRLVTTGQDPSVGPGGYIQNGGHGPLSSTYGLGSQQVLQVTVATTTGEVLVANDVQNADLFWAIRGGGGGQYGVVTEYVIKHFPQPSNVVFGSMVVSPIGEAGVNSSWDAAAVLFKALPDLMDAGIAGAMTMASGQSSLKFSQTIGNGTSGVVAGPVFWAWNTTTEWMDNLINPIASKIRAMGSNATLSVTYSAKIMSNYSSFYSAISGSNTAGGGGVTASRLLGRAHLTDMPDEKLVSYLRRSLVSQNATAGAFATVGFSGGSGVQNAPKERWGALLPAWKDAYLHVYVGGASSTVNDTTSPQAALQANAKWIEEEKEALFREWAPTSGAYLNEANPYNSQFKHDFYGNSYQGLLDVKRKYDPTESLFVLAGVASDGWNYDLQTGTLCRV
ncbi:putative isoamyl alcohol oxidase [Cadophora sp. MPI-SDFR-AT-0126]|nr:putative isoamyl alcohol oxidase [Leotiomycetes sp. MPI-SDFR-AT-0126]